MKLNVRKTIYKEQTRRLEESRHILHWLGYGCDDPFPLVYTMSDQLAHHAVSMMSNRVNLVLRGYVPDTDVYIKGHRHSGFGLRVRITHNQEFPIREDRYNLVDCGQRCGKALFVNHMKFSKLCVQAGPKLHYLNIEQFDDSYHLTRSIFMGLSTFYYKNSKHALKIWRAFLIRPCSDEEINERNIDSNFTLIVNNFQTYIICLKGTYFNLIDIDERRMGPYATIPIENSTQVCSTVETEHFRLTGFLIKHVDTLNVKSTFVLINLNRNGAIQRNYNFDGSRKQICWIVPSKKHGNKYAAQVVSYQHGHHELGSEIRKSHLLAIYI
ncbi:hypothetical protein HZS_4067 [Henneguya salminicola]|nr:hypothetical protein HZS_4067 [Henneguya salminicola]